MPAPQRKISTPKEPPTDIKWEEDKPTMKLSHQILIGVAAFAVIVSLFLARELLGTNDSGYIQVIQEAGTGTMNVRMNPGVYFRAFADVHSYKISDAYDFNSSGDEIAVRFNDASTADISGQIKFRLPMDEKRLLQLHQDFRSYEAVENNLVRQVVASALKQTASMFSSVEVYSTRRADFISLVNEQIKNGIYATQYQQTAAKDANGNVSAQGKTVLKLDDKGNPVVSEPSTFTRYGVEVVQLVINDIKFDEKTNELIAERKRAEQQQVVAKANADKALQDALTAEAQGKANVAQAEAEALVKKKTAVIAAEQETAVATQKALQAEQDKLAIIARGQADAEAAKLKVAAGLTPLDRANIEKETAIGVAHEMANIKLPQVMNISGGGTNGQAIDPFTAIGLKQFLDISKGLSSQKDDK